MKTLFEQYLQNQATSLCEVDLRAWVQQVILLGLWRAHFFQHAVMEGDTCARLFYWLSRDSQNLQFFLLKKDEMFSLQPYLVAVQQELQSVGLEGAVHLVAQEATGGTQQYLLTIATTQGIALEIMPLSILLSLVVCPPRFFGTDIKMLSDPIPFSVLIAQPSDLFNATLQALLYDAQGRDWFDFIFYVGRQIPVNLVHLRERLIDSGHWDRKDVLTATMVKKMLQDKIEGLDIEQAKMDVFPFITDRIWVEAWSHTFFKQAVDKLEFVQT